MNLTSTFDVYFSLVRERENVVANWQNVAIEIVPREVKRGL